MAIDTGIGISLPKLNSLGTFDESVTTTAQAPLGQTVLQPAGADGAGEKVWIYVGITSGVTATLSKGQVVVQDAAQGYGNVEVGTAVDLGRAVGVVQETWPTYADFSPTATELYGWVLRKGEGLASDGGIVANQGAILDAAGAVQASGGVTAANIGFCKAVAGPFAICVFNCNG
jgi:hypothetical protein